MSDGSGNEEGRIAGVVGGELDIPFAQASIETKGKPREFLRTDAFVLETDEGRVEVTVNTFTALLPQRELSGDFGELLDDPLTELVMDAAPGDHVHAKIRGNQLEKGESVVIHGNLVHGHDSDGSYREAPSKRVTRINAHVIAMGEDASALVDKWLEEQAKKDKRAKAKLAAKRDQYKSKQEKRKPSKDPLAPAPRPLFLMWLMAAVTIGLFVMAVPMGLPTFYDDSYEMVGANLFWLAASSSLGMTAFIWRRRRWMPSFHSIGRGGSGKGERWSVGLQLMMGCMFLFITVLALGMMPKVSCYATAALCLYMPVMILWRDQKSANRGLALLRAKRLSSDLPDKRFGSIEGEFEGAIDYKRKHKTHSSTRTVTRTDSNGNSYQAQETTTWVTWNEHCNSDKEARLLREGAEPIELELRDAEWAGSDYKISYPSSGGMGGFLKHMPKKHAKRIRSAARKGEPRLERTAQNGHSILAAARVRKGDDGRVTFKTTGPGSFLLFTAPHGSSARSRLTRHLAAHYLGLLLTASSVALPLYFVLSW